MTGLLAVEGAVKKLAREIRMVAAAVLGVAEEDIELLDGTARVLGDPDRKLALQEVGMIVHVGNAILPQDLDVTLNCNHLYRPPLKVPDKETKRGNLTLTYATQIHACVLEVDEETGEIQILDYAAVDDCGRRIHPQIVEGQVHGATAQGIAAALMETFEYDESGQLLHPNYHEYHVARSVDVPHIKTGHLETPSPFTSNGAKGMGEGGGAPLHAVCSAIQDVLSQTSGAVVTDSHNPPERVYWLLRAQKEGVRLVSPASI